MQLRLLLTLGLAVAFGACTLHEPLPPGVGDDAGTAGGAGGAGQGGQLGGGGKGGVTGAGGLAGAGPGGGGGTAAGGSLGAGGQAGAAGAGGASGKGGAGGKDAGADTLTCGPVCAIFCPNGNVLDERGCPTCKCKPAVCPAIGCAVKCPFGSVKDANGCETCSCNPPPTCQPVTCKLFCKFGFQTGADGCEICACKPETCAPSECGGPLPGAPTQMCSDGSTGGPICERTKEGRCAWIFRACPDPPLDCARATDAATCGLLSDCRWLEPGCVEPKLTTAGCFAKSSIGCTGDASCPQGKSCLKRVVNPCAQGRPAGLVAPPPGGCTACGETLAVCL